MDLITENNYILYVLALAAFGSLIVFIYEKKRTDALKLIATNLGFSFSKKSRDQIEQKHQNFQLFLKGSRGKVKNEMWGNRNGIDISIFGYQYTNGIGQSSRNYQQTVLIMNCKKLKFPTFELKPENTFHKIGRVFGGQDIDFDAFPEFSKEYLLRGDNESDIRQLFTPIIINFFESNKNICIEAQNNTLIFYKPSKRLRPKEIEGFLAEGQRILQVFKY
jgi:hypothetical protein